MNQDQTKTKEMETYPFECPCCGWKPPQREMVPPEVIERLVCDHFGVVPPNLRGRSRINKVASARHLCMYLLRRYSLLTYNEAGRRYNRDHTTVIHAVKRLNNAMFTKQDLYDDLVEIERRILGRRLQAA